MKNKIIIGVIAILVIIAGVAAFQSKGKVTAGNKVKIGVVLPLSGDYAAVGESMKNAMNMSLNDLSNKNVELVFEDGAFNSAKALSAYNKLQSFDQADIIVGLDSPTLEAIKPVINKMDELMFTVGNETSIQEDNVYEIIPWATALFRELGKAVSGKYNKVALVYASDWALAQPNKEQFLKGFDSKNYIEVPVSSNSDVRTEVAKMLAQGVDSYTLLLPIEQGSKFLNEVSKQSGAKRPQLICDGNIELTIGDFLQKVNDKSVFDGCISTMIADTTSKDYTAKYKELYKAEPNFLAVYGYDAVQIVSKALANKDKSDWKKMLDDKSFSFSGVSGKISFDDTGSRVLESEVHIYKDGKFVKLGQ